MVRVAGQPLIDKDTKTHAERRVAVGAETVELLKAHRARQAAAALAAGTTLPPEAHVFSRSPDGSKAISPDGISHRFQELAAQLGVRACLHDLPHFMVTQLVAGGWTGAPSRAGPGHADGHMTLATYAHFQQAQDRQAAEFMDRLLVQLADRPVRSVREESPWRAGATPTWLRQLRPRLGRPVPGPTVSPSRQ